MKYESDVTQREVCEKLVWTTPVLKKGAVGSETALAAGGVNDGFFLS